MGFFRAVANAVANVITFVASIFESDRGHTLPEPLPPLELTITSVSDAKPELGDTVEIKWNYQSSERLTAQAIQLHRLTFEGAVSTRTVGCLPAALLHAGEVQRNCTPLDLGQRAFQFEFEGPVTFHLVADDGEGRILQKYVQLMLPDMSFTVSVSAEQADYPRLGGSMADAGRTLTLTNCFGIYENTRVSPHEATVLENGIIDHLEKDEFRRSFSADAPFFLSSNSHLEAEHFRPALGRGFAKLLEDFLVRPQGQPFAGVKDFADAVVIGAGLAVSGTREVLPTDKGDCEVITSTVIKDLEPIFFQIDTRSGAQDPSHPAICNLHLGNIPQGLVFSTFHGDLSWQGSLTTGSAATVAIQRQQNSTLRKSTGEIKEARLGFVVRKTGETANLPMSAIISASWSGIPVYPDTDISGLLAAQYRLA
jgi:hypothetical protein